MDARDATANNADLWTQYLRQQWSPWLDPFDLADAGARDAAVRVLAEVTAANVASVLTMLVAPQIGRMYRANAPEVSRVVREAAAPEERVEIPAAYASRPRPACSDLTQREEWIVSSPAPQPVGAR